MSAKEATVSASTDISVPAGPARSRVSLAASIRSRIAVVSGQAVQQQHRAAGRYAVARRSRPAPRPAPDDPCCHSGIRHPMRSYRVSTVTSAVLPAGRRIQPRPARSRSAGISRIAWVPLPPPPAPAAASAQRRCCPRQGVRKRSSTFRSMAACSMPFRMAETCAVSVPEDNGHLQQGWLVLPYRREQRPAARTARSIQSGEAPAAITPSGSRLSLLPVLPGVLFSQCRQADTAPPSRLSGSLRMVRP